MCNCGQPLHKWLWVAIVQVVVGSCCASGCGYRCATVGSCCATVGSRSATVSSRASDCVQPLRKWLWAAVAFA